MSADRIILRASLVVFAAGFFWGLYWLPVRQFAILDVPGAWGTAAITLAALILLAPFAIRSRPAEMDAMTLLAIALGGVAFTFYSVGFVYGRIALVTLLFYLTPVWSTLITRYLFGWSTPWLRIIAMIVGFLGLLIMLSATGTAPIPKNLGEWLGLASGVLWAISSSAQRVRKPIPPMTAAFVFVFGACVSAIVLGIILAPWPGDVLASNGWQIAGLALLSGGLWWTVCIASLMWATTKLDPARVGMLLLSEVLVGVATSAWIGGEHISGLELLGGALVVCAGILEVWPERRKRITQ